MTNTQKWQKTVMAAGAVWENSPKEVAKNADVVITCLPLPNHVLENMLGEQGAVEGMEKGTTWIDCSTTDYHNTKHIAGVAAQKGIFSLEAPVSNLAWVKYHSMSVILVEPKRLNCLLIYCFIPLYIGFGIL